jgi:preprotein translocase subunit SecA
MDPGKVKRFNKLVSSINACENWWDDLSTTQEQRKEMYGKLKKSCDELATLGKELKAKPNDYIVGIKTLEVPK